MEAVARGLDLEGPRGTIRLPVDEETTVFVFDTEVDAQPGVRISGPAAPRGGRGGFQDRGRWMLGEGAGSGRDWRGGGGQILERQGLDTELTLAAGSGGDRHFDGRDFGQATAAGGAPGEVDPAAGDP